ncbi:MAG: hypothetical protein HQL25_01750 [Candidatus Omnitrophica bacterium]|nr:hypothetical protein [Candidatus Omnitrophota bacterium]
MLNKFVYSISKDLELKRRVIGLLIALPICIIIWNVYHAQTLALKDILTKEALNRINSAKAQGLSLQVNSYQLSGIITNDINSFAIINGRMMKVGDKVGNNKIMRIIGRDVTLCDKDTSDKCIHLVLEK